MAGYNDPGSVQRLFDTHRDQIAAVIVEPIAGNMGVVPPADGFLRALRDVCTAGKALLIFDEVISGFRAAPGGAQQLAGVAPDLTCLGKIIGGGLPVGAYGGRADLMELVSPAGPVYQAGTLSGNPLAMTAGLWSLGQLRASTYAYLAKLATRLGAGLAAAAREAGVALAGQRGRLRADAVLHGSAGPRLSVGHEREHRTLRAVFPGDAGAGRLSAAVTVRGVVSLDGAHGEGCGQDDRGGAGGDEGSEEQALGFRLWALCKARSLQAEPEA